MRKNRNYLPWCRIVNISLPFLESPISRSFQLAQEYGIDMQGIIYGGRLRLESSLWGNIANMTYKIYVCKTYLLTVPKMKLYTYKFHTENSIILSFVLISKHFHLQWFLFLRNCWCEQKYLNRLIPHVLKRKMVLELLPFDNIPRDPSSISLEVVLLTILESKTFNICICHLRIKYQ